MPPRAASQPQQGQPNQVSTLSGRMPVIPYWRPAQRAKHESLRCSVGSRGSHGPDLSLGHSSGEERLPVSPTARQPASGAGSRDGPVRGGRITARQWGHRSSGESSATAAGSSAPSSDLARRLPDSSPALGLDRERDATANNDAPGSRRRMATARHRPPGRAGRRGRLVVQTLVRPAAQAGLGRPRPARCRRATTWSVAPGRPCVPTSATPAPSG